MKNNKLKLIIFILLLSVLFIPKTITTFAEEARGNSVTHNITIKGASKDHTFKAYQIFKGDLHTKDGKDVLSNIQWGDAVNGEKLLEALKESEEKVIEKNKAGTSTDQSKAIKEIFGECKTARDVAEILTIYENDSDMVRIFAELASSHLKTDGEATSTVSSNYNEGSNSYTLAVPADGYYLIKDETADLNEKNEFYTRYILKIANNVTITVKGEVPTVDKHVANTGKGKDEQSLNHDDKSLEKKKVVSAETGEVLEFTLTGTLPTNYKDYKQYKYIFHDTLSKGLTFKNDSIKVYKVIEGSEEKEINLCSTQEEKKDCYTIEVQHNEESDVETTLTIKFEDLKKVITDEEFDKGYNKEAGQEPKIIVKYYAYLNKNAVVGGEGNPNTVYLEYSNNPNSAGKDKTGNTPEKTVKVYTYQLDINKQDGKTKQPLKDVGFKLYKKVKGADGNEKPFYAVMEKNGEVTSNNPYVIEKWVESLEEATELITGDNGNISIKGLKAGTYYLKETTTPEGYNTIGDVTIKITEELTGNEEPATEQKLTSLSIEATWIDNEKEQKDEGTKNGSTTEGVVKATILNMPGSELPSTGGIGTLFLYAIGIILVIIAFLIFGIKYQSLNKINKV